MAGAESEEDRLLGKEEMVIWEIDDALEVWVADTVESIRLAFWSGNVSSGREKPSSEQVIVRASSNAWSFAKVCFVTLVLGSKHFKQLK